VSEAAKFPNLRDRVRQFLTENGGMATDDDLIRHVFQGQGRGWGAVMTAILENDERVERVPTGWRLRESAAEVGEHGRYVSLITFATGPKPPRARLLVVGAASFANWRMTSSAEWTIRPERPSRLPSGLGEAGVSLEDLAESPTFAAIANELLDYIGDQPLISFDVALSVAFLQFELRRAGLPSLGNPLVDLTAIAEARLGARPDLGRLAAYFHLPSPRALSPLRRAEFVGHIAAALLGDGAPTSPIDAKLATRQRPLLNPATATSAPEGPGVYLFRDADGRVVYVGKSRSLRRRLLTYCTSNLDKSRNMAGLIALVESVEVRSTLCPLDSAILEARLIAHHIPPFNVHRRAGARLVFASVDADGGRPQLRWSGTPGNHAFGPLRLIDARQAVRTVLANHRPRPDAPRHLVREARLAWAQEAAARLNQILREIALPSPIDADPDGIRWMADGEVEVGLSARGWVGSREVATGRYLASDTWTEPPCPATEWALALAIKRRTGTPRPTDHA
jgi:DNA polymerase III epsilon subunit-like protein